MVRTKDDIIRTLKKYIEEANKVFFIKKPILFGSYANGKPHKWSDIDISLVSPDFDRIPEDMSMKLLFRLASFVDTSIEPTPLGEDEFGNPSIGSVAYDIQKSGRVIYSIQK